MFYGVFSAITALFLAPLQYLKVHRQEFQTPYLQNIKKNFNRKNWANFFHGSVPYIVMNFISSASFGIFDYFSAKMIFFLNSSILLTIFIRATFGGLGEALATCYFEFKTIIQNKDFEENKSNTNVSIAIILLIIRNAFIWSAAIIVFEISPLMHWNNCQSTIISIILGIIFGIISTPLDVLITRNCGTKLQESLWQQCKEILINYKQNGAFAGGLMRFIQMGIYSAVTLLTMLFLQKFGFCT